MQPKEEVMNFDELTEAILKCNDCETKFGFHPIPILHGTVNSKIFQISQAPSHNVHLTRTPFNDSTGKKLKYEWYRVNDDVFYNKDNFYISALGHCFPGKNSKGGDKLPPKYCSDKWLRKEINLVNNILFIIIGAKAAKYFFPHSEYNDLIFRDSNLNGKTTIVLPHPSPLNIKWFKDHPDFESNRLPEIRAIILNILGVENDNNT